MSSGSHLEPPSEADRREVAHAGLCARCVHLQVLRSKSTTFVRCALSDEDERFPRYPRLPVRACSGHEPQSASRASTRP